MIDAVENEKAEEHKGDPSDGGKSQFERAEPGWVLWKSGSLGVAQALQEAGRKALLRQPGIRFSWAAFGQ